MAAQTTVREIMVDVFEYPHIPYWFTLRQAAGIIRNTLLGGEKHVHPLVVLVFDEKYNLVGMANLREIMKGLEPLWSGAGGAGRGRRRGQAGLGGPGRDRHALRGGFRGARRRASRTPPGSSWSTAWSWCPCSRTARSSSAWCGGRRSSRSVRARPSG